MPPEPFSHLRMLVGYFCAVGLAVKALWPTYRGKQMYIDYKRSAGKTRLPVLAIR
jgi:hypothetical protein